MIKEKEIEFNTIFKFPSNITKERLEDGRYLFISELTANWLVLTEEELFPFTLLLEGKEVGEILNEGIKQSVLSSTLAKIMAREFAGIDETPQPVIYTNTSEGLHAYLTHGCNIRCKHCYMYAGNKQKKELTVDEWQKLLSAFRENGGKTVTFSGGEPLMYKGFVELVKFSYSLGLEVSVLSNGLLWNDMIINEIAPYVRDVQISIDGVDEESYQKVRKNGSFSKAIETVVKLANIGIHVDVATTFTFDNLDSTTKTKYKSLVEKLRLEGGENIDFILTKKLLPGRDVHYSDAEEESYYNRIVEINRYVLKDVQECNFIEGHEPNVQYKNCGLGGLTIDSNGDVYYCSRTSEIFSDGNALQRNIDYFLGRGAELNKLYNVDNIEPCKDCKLRYICGGECKIELFNVDEFTSKTKSPKVQKYFENCKKKLKQTLVRSFDAYYKFN